MQRYENYHKHSHYSNITTLDVIVKPEDIMKLYCVGKNKALDIRRMLKRKFINEGYLIPNNQLPMNKVIEELKIDVQYLKLITDLNK